MRMRMRAGAGSIFPTRMVLLLAFVLTFLSLQEARAQTGCALTPDDRNPFEQILRCGQTLVVRQAPGTVYRTIEGAGGAPRALMLDSGAVLVEFRRDATRKSFQVLTPYASAAVRGTKWAVEIEAAKMSTLVLSGRVVVRRNNATERATLGPGDGVDVSADESSLIVKKWPAARVRALLARFGE